MRLTVTSFGPKPLLNLDPALQIHSSVLQNLSKHMQHNPKMSTTMLEDPFADSFQYLEDTASWPHIDPESKRQNLLRSTWKLFTCDSDDDVGECCLQMTKIGSEGIQKLQLEDLPSVCNELNESERISYNTCLFYIRQSYTWGPLLLPLGAFVKLLEYLKVHPAFLEVVYLFCEKSGPVEESCTAYHDSLYPVPTKDIRNGKSLRKPKFEVSYSIKYPEPHGREYLKDPFSIREIGIYHKMGNRRSDFICIQMPGSIQERVERFLQAESSVTDLNHLRTHAIILLTASEHWRPYICHLEETFSKLVDKRLFMRLGLVENEDDGGIADGVKGIQQLQMLTDKLHRLIHLLSLAIDVTFNIQDLANRLKAEAEDNRESIDQTLSDLNMCLVQLRIHKSRLESLTTRSIGISTLIQQSLQVRTASSNIQISRTMNNLTKQTRDLTEQGLRETELMKTMTRYTTSDTRSMMLIALMTTVFLPATFVATLFGSNFFGYQRTDGSAKLEAASNTWVYVVVTLVLLIITITIGFILWRKTRVKQDDEEMADEK